MLKKIDEKELKARKAAAEEQFRGRKGGINHFAEVDPTTGRAISGYQDGGIETALVKYAEDLIPIYIEYTSKGYTLTPLGTVALDAHTFEIYFNRPESQIKPLLDAILKKVESDYVAEIEAANEQFIQEQVDAQLRVDAAREQRELAAAEAERRAKVEKQIRETFQPAEEVAAPTVTKGRKQ